MCDLEWKMFFEKEWEEKRGSASLLESHKNEQLVQESRQPW